MSWRGAKRRNSIGEPASGCRNPESLRKPRGKEHLGVACVKCQIAWFPWWFLGSLRLGTEVGVEACGLIIRHKGLQGSFHKMARSPSAHEAVYEELVCGTRYQAGYRGAHWPGCRYCRNQTREAGCTCNDPAQSLSREAVHPRVASCCVVVLSNDITIGIDPSRESRVLPAFQLKTRAGTPPFYQCPAVR